MKMVALIPARAGSKRIPGKNTRLLAGHPLIYWTLRAAYESNVFFDIACSTDDPETGFLAAEVANVRYIVRPPEFSTDDSPDIDWVRHVLDSYRDAEAFAILRPTSPFRTAETIRRAFKQFSTSEVHSIRAVQPVTEHPGKMWTCRGAGYPMWPLIGRDWPPEGKDMQSLRTRDDMPWHSMPTQSLPRVWVQNSSLEMAWTYVVKAFGTISGTKIAPFLTEGAEGFSIDYPEDWDRAEQIARDHPEYLPHIQSRATA